MPNKFLFHMRRGCFLTRQRAHEGDMDLGQHSLSSCFDVPAHLLVHGHPQKAPTASHENRSYPPPPRFRNGLEERPETPYHRPIVHVGQLTLTSCYLTSRMKLHCSGSAHLDGSYGNTSRGSPSRPLQPLLVPPSPERLF
jgi:hypothetical protein